MKKQQNLNLILTRSDPHSGNLQEQSQDCHDCQPCLGPGSSQGSDGLCPASGDRLQRSHSQHGRSCDQAETKAAEQHQEAEVSKVEATAFGPRSASCSCCSHRRRHNLAACAARASCGSLTAGQATNSFFCFLFLLKKSWTWLDGKFLKELNKGNIEATRQRGPRTQSNLRNP